MAIGPEAFSSNGTTNFDVKAFGAAPNPTRGVGECLSGSQPVWSHARSQLFIRHALAIPFRDVDVRYEKEDLRPAILLDDVVGADFTSRWLTAKANSRHPSGDPAQILAGKRPVTTSAGRK